MRKCSVDFVVNHVEIRNNQNLFDALNSMTVGLTVGPRSGDATGAAVAKAERRAAMAEVVKMVSCILFVWKIFSTNEPIDRDCEGRC